MADPRQLLMASDPPRFDAWKLRMWREERAMTQTELAAKMGGGKWAHDQLSRVERYECAPSKRNVRRLVLALGLPEAYLASTAQEWAANRAEYDAWCAGGRPPLARWLRERSGGTNA